MTKKELRRLIIGHFTPSTHMNTYAVFIAEGEVHVFLQEELNEDTVIFGRKVQLDVAVVIKSPLSRDDFEKLAKAKMDDTDFWAEAVLRNNGEVLKYEFGGI